MLFDTGNPYPSSILIPKVELMVLQCIHTVKIRTNALKMQF